MPSGFPEGIFVIIRVIGLGCVWSKKIAYRYLKEVVCGRFNPMEFQSRKRVAYIVNAFYSLTSVLFTKII